MTQALELYCPVCQSVELCGPTQMLARLRSLSLLRRDNSPPVDILHELFRTSADRFSCHDCDSTGLLVRKPREEEWGASRKCVDCGTPIPNERLELFPLAERCAACEAKPNRDEREFCPRCGQVLQLRLRSGRGVSKYEMVCPQCR